MVYQGEELGDTVQPTHDISTPRPEVSQRAFSLIEVMMAVAILSVGLAGVISQISTLDRQRRWTRDVTQARMVAEYLSNGIQGMKWEDLNDRSKPEAYLYWSRYPDADGVLNDNNFLSDSAPLVANSQDPTQRRRLPFLTGLDDARVYLEYFRAQTATDSSGTMLLDTNLPCQGGLLESRIVGNSIDISAPADRINPGLSGMTALGPTRVIPALVQPGTVAQMRLPEDESINAQVGVRIADRDPVAIRISVVWRSRTDNDVWYVQTLITGKTR
jgi:prepilin-type N-terminal cleavage/methylation domain-containing protein